VKALQLIRLELSYWRSERMFLAPRNATRKAPSETAATLKPPCFGILEKEPDEQRSSGSITLTNLDAEKN
jgi:hypothetical protein